MSYRSGYRTRSRHITAVLLFLIGIGLTVGLYTVKTRAQSARKHMVHLEKTIETEKAALIVLRAELAHRESPARLAELAEAELGLMPIKTDRVIRMSEIEQVLPLPAGTGGGSDD